MVLNCDNGVVTGGIYIAGVLVTGTLYFFVFRALLTSQYCVKLRFSRVIYAK